MTIIALSPTGAALLLDQLARFDLGLYDCPDAADELPPPPEGALSETGRFMWRENLRLLTDDGLRVFCTDFLVQYLDMRHPLPAIMDRYADLCDECERREPAPKTSNYWDTDAPRCLWHRCLAAARRAAGVTQPGE